MKNLPPINGLHTQVADLRQSANRNDVRARAVSGCPRGAHEAAMARDRELSHAHDMEKVITEKQALIREINKLIERKMRGKNKSAYSTIALRKMEEAEDALRRELGNAEN